MTGIDDTTAAGPPKRPIGRNILIWLGINTVIGLLIGSIVAANSSYPALQVMLIALINTHIISSCSAAAGYYFGRKFKGLPPVRAIFFTLIGVWPATVLGFALCALTYNLIRRITLEAFIRDQLPGLIVPCLILAAVITAVTIVIEGLIAQRNALASDLRAMEGRAPAAVPKAAPPLPVRERDRHYLVAPGAIVYLSSHGKKTIIHTEERDYESSQLIREFEDMLDQDQFLRVHKQFIVNADFIAAVRYDAGGRYLARLKDADESTIPVGRAYAAALKGRLGI